jgi:hypothetical protein
MQTLALPAAALPALCAKAPAGNHQPSLPSDARRERRPEELA